MNLDNQNRTALFLEWLRKNGAKFQKVKWPEEISYPLKDLKNLEDANVEGEEGELFCRVFTLRGAKATDDICTKEFMIEIPEKLMFSERFCREESELKNFFKKHSNIFKRDDPLLAFALTHEKINEKKSFFYPYLQILHKPETLCYWTNDEMLEVQDDELCQKAYSREDAIQASFREIMEIFDEEDEAYMNKNSYSLEDYRFFWHVIQSRSFGRRLPWTSLVPLADCLNHGNVATKYDFNVNQNGTFRLFPSGNNHYTAGSEILNSYGRASNQRLLLDYGFTLQNNCWNYFELNFDYKCDNVLWNEQYLILQQSGLIIKTKFRFSEDDIWTGLLPYCRCLIMTSEELHCFRGSGKSLWKPFDIRNELASISMMLDIYQSNLAQFSTSINEDKEIFRKLLQNWESNPEHARKKSALIYRISRKSIVHQQMKMLQEVVRGIKEIKLDLSALSSTCSRYALRMKPLLQKYFHSIVDLCRLPGNHIRQISA